MRRTSYLTHTHTHTHTLTHTHTHTHSHTHTHTQHTQYPTGSRVKVKALSKEQTSRDEQHHPVAKGCF
jgi:hypothetical protein